MNRKMFLGLFLCLLSTSVFAQSNLLNAKKPEDIGKKTAAQDSLDNDTPLPYGYVGDRDILFSKKVWERIDLNQRINFPLYFPVEDLTPDRRPLYNVLMEAVKDSTISEVFSDSYFNTKLTYKDIEAKLENVRISDEGTEIMNEDLVAYQSGKKKLDEQYVIKTKIEADAITAYDIVGVWYFDKRQGELKYRILGISPLAPDVNVLAQDNVTEEQKAELNGLFWIYYPSARDVLHKASAFNEKNSAIPINFDHLLNARRFSATITKEENVYGDRDIQDYLKDQSQMQLLEAERVKEKIRNFEQDMWNY
ncbi:gliding motility protein GldN [Flavobacterium sp. RHBU_24]|uniref:type IX secretion system ring protein PorN/GldN n=1 Tax=Flavobacterium sp. RHBU_24 TaxID=3391185 RepID=UPI0039849A1E